MTGGGGLRFPERVPKGTEGTQTDFSKTGKGDQKKENTLNIKKKEKVLPAKKKAVKGCRKKKVLEIARLAWGPCLS